MKSFPEPYEWPGLAQFPSTIRSWCDTSFLEPDRKQFLEPIA